LLPKRREPALASFHLGVGQMEKLQFVLILFALFAILLVAIGIFGEAKAANGRLQRLIDLAVDQDAD
jgi:hypothetical protein